jgi:DNA-binding transcriptional MerR regulator
MRISELSVESGVAIATIKYYLREGLLPGGVATGPNQARYDDTHLYRLRLIRALLDVGGLSVAAAGEVLAAVDDPTLVGHELLGVAHRAVAPAARSGRDRPEWSTARAQAAALVAGRGWRVDDCAPALDQLADVLAVIHGLGLEELAAGLDGYADAAELAARHDLAAVAARAHRAGQDHIGPRLADAAPGSVDAAPDSADTVPDSADAVPDSADAVPDSADASQGRADAARRTLLLEAVIAGTVLGEALFAALRRLAQEDASARWLVDGGPEPARD